MGEILTEHERARIMLNCILLENKLPVKSFADEYKFEISQFKIRYVDRMKKQALNIMDSFLEGEIIQGDENSYVLTEYGQRVFGENGQFQIKYVDKTVDKLLEDVYGQDKVKTLLSKQPGLATIEITEHDCNSSYIQRMKKNNSLVSVYVMNSSLHFLQSRDFGPEIF